MDVEDIARINPHDIRVRLTVRKPAELAQKNVRLILRYFYGAKYQADEFSFELELIEKQTFVVNPLFGSSYEDSVYTYRLSEASVEDFYRQQRHLSQYGNIKRYEWQVFYYLQDADRQIEELTIDIELQLRPGDGYFYLFKDAAIKVNRRTD